MKKIVEARKKKNVSQYKLAAMTGISRFRISMFECGYKEPSKEELSKMKEVLK